MSRQLTITAPGLANTSTQGTYTRPLTGTDRFSAVPSNTFTSGWIVHRANLSIKVWSYGLIASGDVWVRITNSAGTMTDLFGEINPFKGSSHSCSVLPYVSSRGDFTNVSVRFNSTLGKTVGFSGLTISYLGLPYSFSVRSNGNGTVSYSHSNVSDTSIQVSASPSTGYKFSHWSDGSTANPYHYDPGTEVSSASLSATFVPIGYTVNYYDCTSGEDILLHSQTCSYDSTYDVYPLPQYMGTIPEGHDINSAGWVLSKDELAIRHNTTQAYFKTNLNTPADMYSSTFKNLTSKDNAVVNLYYNFYQKSYAINYFSYTKEVTNPSPTTVYRIYNEGDYILKDLPEPTLGYKLTNKMLEENSEINPEITNAWFTNTMNPGNETITQVSSMYLDDISIYSKEIPISYTVNYYDYSSGEGVLIHSDSTYLYDETYDYLPLPELNNIPQGYSPNPTGWLLNPTAIIRYEDNAILNNKTSLTLQTQYSGTFSNLTSIDKGIINYYFNLIPYYYKISYLQYTNESSETPIGQDWYVFNEVNEISLRNLTPAKTGYKLTNQIDPETNLINSNLINNWFIDSGFMQPGNNTKTTLLQSELTKDYVFYQNEIPIEYKINYYNNEELLFTQECIYDMPYSYLELPSPENDPDEGYSYNPTGWIEYNDSTVRNSTLDIYKIDDLETKLQQYSGEFINITDEDKKTINLYFNAYPIHYLVSYVKYEQGDTSTYTLDTRYRIYGQDYNTINLPNPTPGYKLVNKMEEINGPESLEYDNVWLTDINNLTPLGDKTMSIPSTYTSDITLYSFEVPKNFSILLNIFDQYKTKIDTKNIDCVYGENYSLNDNILEEKTGCKFIGWYTEEKPITLWHIDSITNELSGSFIDTNINSYYSAPTDIQDQSQIIRYGYYIPYGYYISYNWLDNYGGNDYQLPDKVIRVYGRENVAIETIPDYDNYIVENANTKKWYYYHINEETGEESYLENEQTVIQSTDQNNYEFFARKHPYKRHITFTINNEYFGTISIDNQTDDDLYNEGDIITITALPTEVAYFSNWSDGNNETVRTITVGDKDAHYTAVFRSNQIYVNSLGILGAYKNTQLVKEINNPKKSLNTFQYNVSNISSPYGFYLNNNNYYESNNKGKASTYAVCRVTFTASTAMTIYIDCINYAESSYDFGLLSKINTSLSLNNSVDSSSKLQKNFSGSQYSSIQTVTYQIPEGISFIDIKYKKDGSVDSNNDSLQFKIRY